jgi:hypothetical protein
MGDNLTKRKPNRIKYSQRLGGGLAKHAKRLTKTYSAGEALRSSGSLPPPKLATRPYHKFHLSTWVF